MRQWFLYIVVCCDKSLYTGITTDIKRRVSEHNAGVGAKSLKGKLPVKLAHFETFDNQIDARKREAVIKGWKRENKLRLIQRNSQIYLRN